MVSVAAECAAVSNNEPFQTSSRCCKASHRLVPTMRKRETASREGGTVGRKVSLPSVSDDVLCLSRDTHAVLERRLNFVVPIRRNSPRCVQGVAGAAQKAQALF